MNVQQSMAPCHFQKNAVPCLVSDNDTFILMVDEEGLEHHVE